MDKLTSFDFWQLLFVLAVLIAIFFIFRELVLWYYGINERIELLKQNNTLLTEIRDLLKTDENNSNSTKKPINLSDFEGDGDVNDPKVFDTLLDKIKK